MNLSPASSSRVVRFARNSSTRIGVACLHAVIALLLLGSSVPGYGQEDFSVVRTQPTLWRHVMRPAAPGANRSQQRVEQQPRVATNAQPSAVNTGTGIVYTCASNVAASTCNYLNTAIAGYYNSVFTNANAAIYVQYGSTGLGQSVGFYNLVHYTPYVTALTNLTNKSSIQTSALAAINTYATPVYGTQNIMNISVALGSVLGFTGLLGINSAATASCTPYTTGCYNEIVTVADAASQAAGGFTLYYDDQGGTEGVNQYDFYAVVEHETDEVLGTSSCISTTSSSLVDGCDGPAPAGSNGVPSAVDLDRYASPAHLAPDTTPSTAAGQYFSFDGGVHYGAIGDASTPTAKVYNTLSNGDDFADYVASSPNCGSNQAVQDATGCPGQDAGLTVFNDGQSELTIFNTIGFTVPEAVITSPTPGSTLTGSSATFTWSAVSGASQYAVYVGATGVGSSDIYASPSAITATSQAVTGLPTSGTIYVRIYSYLSGFWTSIDYTYIGGSSAPAVTLTPTSLTFASTPVGSTTAAQMVTVKNTGAATLTLTSELITGTNASSFIVSANTCGSSLAAGASCAVSVQFKPAAAGTLTASLSIADNATGSPQTAMLSGTGTSSTLSVTLTPSSIAFPATVVTLTSNAQLATLKNTGTSTVTISSIAIGGTNASSFKEIGTCGASLAAGASCSNYIGFRPQSAAALTGALVITDNAPGSPHQVTLTGTGTAVPTVTLSPTSLSFPTTAVGSTSLSQTVTVKNTGAVTLNVTGVTLTGTNPADFIALKTCLPTLAPGATCSVYVAFKPVAAAAYTANLSLSDSGASAPQIVPLSGTGH